MNDFEDLIKRIDDVVKKRIDEAVKKLSKTSGDACKELASDTGEKSATDQYFLRPGGIVRCRSNGKWSYAVLISSDDVVSVEKDGALKEYSLQEFLDDRGAEQLQVAFQDRISVGAYDVAHCARMESYDEEQYSASKSFVLHCLGQDDCGSVNAAIEERFGAFEWLQYEIPVNESETAEEEEKEEEEVLPRKKAPLRLRTLKEEEEES